MKRIVSFLILLMLLGGGVHYFNPKELNTSPSPLLDSEKKEKGAVAPLPPSKVEPAHPEQPSPEDVMATLKEEKRVKDAWYARATLFESELTREDILKITENHPDSFFRHAGYFSTQWLLRKKCTKEEYEKLKRKIPLEEIHERAGAILVLVQMYDDEHLPDCTKKIRALWKTDARWNEFRDLDDYYADVGLLLEQTKRSDSENESRKVSYEKTLIESGIAKKDIRDYVFRTALLSPPCLANSHLDFYKWIREDITRVRGQYFLNRLKKYWTIKHEIPSDFAKLLPSPNHPMSKHLLDGWSNDFKIKVDNTGILTLYSVGYDGEAGNKDDIRIGSFSSR